MRSGKGAYRHIGCADKAYRDDGDAAAEGDAEDQLVEGLHILDACRLDAVCSEVFKKQAMEALPIGLVQGKKALVRKIFRRQAILLDQRAVERADDAELVSEKPLCPDRVMRPEGLCKAEAAVSLAAKELPPSLLESALPELEG